MTTPATQPTSSASSADSPFREWCEKHPNYRFWNATDIAESAFHAGTKSIVPQVVQAPIDSAQDLLYISMELSGVIGEYRSMPCSSLQDRMFQTLDRYMPRINKARSALSNLEVQKPIGYVNADEAGNFGKIWMYKEPNSGSISGNYQFNIPVYLAAPIVATVPSKFPSAYLVFSPQGEELGVFRFRPDQLTDMERRGHILEPLYTAAPSPTEQASSLPDRDLSVPAEQQGLFRKFDVCRVDGSDAPGGKHHGCEYFVLDVDHDQHAPAALLAYADACKETHPALSADLIERHATTAAKGNAPAEAKPDGMCVLSSDVHHKSVTLGFHTEQQMQAFKSKVLDACEKG